MSCDWTVNQAAAGTGYRIFLTGNNSSGAQLSATSGEFSIAPQQPGIVVTDVFNGKAPARIDVCVCIQASVMHILTHKFIPTQYRDIGQLGHIWGRNKTAYVNYTAVDPGDTFTLQLINQTQDVVWVLSDSTYGAQNPHLYSLVVCGLSQCCRRFHRSEWECYSLEPIHPVYHSTS